MLGSHRLPWFPEPRSLFISLWLLGFSTCVAPRTPLVLSDCCTVHDHVTLLAVLTALLSVVFNTPLSWVLSCLRNRFTIPQNFAPERGFVNTSAMLSLVATCSNVSAPDAIASLVLRKEMATCFF